MRVLALGGIRSGKSRWAEDMIAELAGGQPVRYLATGAADVGDGEWSARVDAHRRRRPPHWVTCETVDVAMQLRSETPTATLVDDIGGWLTATMDRENAWAGGSINATADDLLDAVAAHPVPLALVSPEVGLTVVPHTAAGRRFADELGALNQRLARMCEQVVLVVAGQPVQIKRE